MPAANTSLMTGETHVLFNALPSVMPLLKDGKLRALGVTTAKRVRFLPDVPAVAETVAGYAVTGWLGFGAPKGTPPEIVNRLNKEVNTALADPAVLKRLANLGSEPFTGSPADFGKFVEKETEKWAKVVKFAGLKVQ
jgi:tripartite-type tricarboxylate transporter receptor subunit TctC